MSKQSIEIVKTQLQIEENIELHKKGWRFQRIGWLFIGAIVLLAAVGMFGDGIVSSKKKSAGGVEISYDRFHRREAKMQLKFDVATSSEPVVDIGLDNKYLSNFKIESVFPEAREVKVSEGIVHYIFDITGPSRIIFYVVPQREGSLQGTISVNKNVIPITHFIYP